MRVDLFDFELPDHVIAQSPVNPRHNAKMLNLTGEGFSDHIVMELPNILRSGDLLVCNDTKVIPSRLFGMRGEAKVEVTLHKQDALDQWHAFARPAKRLRLGDIVVFSDDFQAEVIEKMDGGQVSLRFSKSGAHLMEALHAHGVMPLPPYIRRKGEDRPMTDEEDRESYQTMFAEREGAVAAPTAGLHFTPELKQALSDAGIGMETLTLHVGAGTFLPVKADDTNDHQMHAEWGEISEEAAAKINETRKNGDRIVAVGTTSLRTLESAVDEKGIIHPFSRETDIFITPGYKLRGIDMLLTNFHLPKSTLFMLVSAIQGLDRMKAAYGHAIENDYRFYSYGDCCLMDVRDFVAG